MLLPFMCQFCPAIFTKKSTEYNENSRFCHLYCEFHFTTFPKVFFEIYREKLAKFTCIKGYLLNNLHVAQYFHLAIYGKKWQWVKNFLLFIKFQKGSNMQLYILYAALYIIALTLLHYLIFYVSHLCCNNIL